jgi:hypothetical protein
MELVGWIRNKDTNDNSTVQLVLDNHDNYDVYEFSFRIASPDFYSLVTPVVGIAMTESRHCEARSSLERKAGTDCFSRHSISGCTGGPDRNDACGPDCFTRLPYR